jgi:hypothetical protein
MLTVLDQLLQPVHTVEVAVLVAPEDVSRFEEAVSRKGLFGALRVLEVTRKNIGSP